MRFTPDPGLSDGVWEGAQWGPLSRCGATCTLTFWSGRRGVIMRTRRMNGFRLAVTAAAMATSTIAVGPLEIAPVAVAAPAGFVTAVGDALTLDGAPYTFTGMNVYNANNTGGCWNALSDTVLEESLDAIGGQRVIRAWFFQSLATSGGVRDWWAFDRTLAFAAARGMKVIPTLGNQWGACDGPIGGPGVDKDEAWYRTGYASATSPGSSVSYRDWVAEVVDRYANDPTVLAWQLMNEAEVKPVVGDGLPCSAEAALILRDFAADVSTLVKSIDPDHLVSLGTIGGGQCGTSFEEYAFVHDLPTIDVCEYHDYGPPTAAFSGDEFNGLAKRIAQCDALDKPLIIGESGIRPSDVNGTLAGRASTFRAKIEAQLDAGIDGVLLWAWNPDGSTLADYDIGPGDPTVTVLSEVLAPTTSPDALFMPEVAWAQGFSDGVATEIGLVPRDLAWDTLESRLLVADCEVLRAVDPVANTSTVIAIAADLPNPTNVATFVGRVYEVAVRTDGTVLLGLADSINCIDLYWQRVAQLNPTGAAISIAGHGSTPAAPGVPAAQAEWHGLRELATSDAGSIIVVTGDPAVHEFVQGGLISSPIDVTGTNVITLSASGELYRSSDTRLWAIDQAGVERLITGELSSTSFARAMTVDGDGAVWLVGGTDVVRVDGATGAIEQISDISSTGGSVPSYWATVAVSPGGDAFTTSDDSDVTPSGRVIAVSAGSGATVVAGTTTDRWQGEGRPASRQQFDFSYNVLHGRPRVAADAGGDLHVFGSRLAAIDGGTGSTSTDPEPEAFWVGQRPNGDDVLTVPTVPGQLFPRRLVARSDATGALTPLLTHPFDPASEPVIDVAPDGTVYVGTFYGAEELVTIDVDGAVTTEPLGSRPLDEFGNPADVYTFWATASGLFAHLSTGLFRRVGSTWVDAGTCASGDGPFSPLVALRDGRFVGTVAVGAGFGWCRVDPATGTGALLAEPVTFPIPMNARAGTDDFVYYEGAGTDGGGLEIYRMRVNEAAPSTITLALATDPAGAADVFTAAGPIAGAISHGQQLTATVTAGTSTVSVTGPTGWASTGVACDDSDSAAGAINGQVVFRTAPGDNVRCTVVMARTDADLSITKTVDQPSVVSSGTLVYTLTAANAGPGVATDVVLLDALPGGVAFASAGGGCTHDGQPTGGDVVCNVGDVDAGESVTRTISVIAGPAGVVANSAGVASATVDSNPADNGSAMVKSDVLPAQFNPCQTGPGNELWTFGDNAQGQMGSLVPGSLSNPVPVNLLRNVVQIDGGDVGSLALLDDGTVCSWGYNHGAALGRPPGLPSPGFDALSRPTPAPVVDSAGNVLSADRVVSNRGLGGFAIVDPDGDGVGALWGWGYNSAGQVTPGAPTFSVPSARPVPLPGDVAVRDVASNVVVAAAVTADHRVLTWGNDTGDGLGPFTGNQTGLVPSDLTPFLPLRSGELPERVFALAHRIVVVTDQGRGLCYAATPATTDPVCNDTIPVVFDTDAAVIEIDGSTYGDGIALLVDDDGDGAGEVLVWGSHPGNGMIGELGIGLETALVPEAVSSISVGAEHTLAIGVSGRVWGWGNLYQGRLGSGGVGEVLFPIPLGITGADLVEASSAGSFVRGILTDTTQQFESLDQAIARGATADTDAENDGATSADQIETAITNSSSLGSIGRLFARATEGPVDPAIAPNLPGYRTMSQMVTIVGSPDGGAPPPADDPYLVRFNLYLTPAQRAAQATFGGFVESIAVLRNGAAVPTCTTPAPPHTADPCVRSRRFDSATGNAVIVVATTRFSSWAFASPVPTADAGGPYVAVEGTPLQLEGSVAGAPTGTAVEWQSTIEEITFDDAYRVDAIMTAPDDASTILAFTAAAAEQTSVELVELTVVNAPPTISGVIVPATAAPGTAVSLSAVFTDPGRGDTHDIVIDWGDGTPPTHLASTTAGGGQVDTTHTLTTAGSTSVTVTVTDDDGGTASATRSIAVAAANTAPVVRADMGVAGLEIIGFQTGLVVLTGSFNDTQGNGPFRASVRWTAGGTFTPLIINSDRSFAAAWLYLGTSARTVTVRICDAAGACGKDDLTVRPNVSAKVTPVMQCVADRGSNHPSGRYEARWSYNNPSSVALAIPVVPNLENTFTSAPARRGQPEIFLPGRTNDAFRTPFTTGSLTWKANGKSAQANSSSARC